MLMKLMDANGILLNQYRLKSMLHGLEMAASYPDAWVVEFVDDKGLIARFRREKSFADL